jgi:hypothetical protein
VARIFGFNFSGFFAWWMWRTVYLSKLPGLDKKVRVAFDWTLDLFFPKDVCAVLGFDHGRDFHRDLTRNRLGNMVMTKQWPASQGARAWEIP